MRFPEVEITLPRIVNMLPISSVGILALLESVFKLAHELSVQEVTAEEVYSIDVFVTLECIHL